VLLTPEEVDEAARKSVPTAAPVSSGSGQGTNVGARARTSLDLSPAAKSLAHAGAVMPVLVCEDATG
jgi:hypothetical protein